MSTPRRVDSMLFFGLAVEEHIPFLPPGQIIAFPPSVLSHIIIRFQSFLARCPNGSFSARKNTHFSLCKKSSLPLFQKLKRKKTKKGKKLTRFESQTGPPLVFGGESVPLLGLKPTLQRLVCTELALILGGGFGPGTNPAGGHRF